jgi:hypothetical protein
MAIIPLTSVNRGNCQTLTWAGMTTDDTGQPWERADYQDKTVQIFGNFGGTASVSIYGSNDPRVITDPANAVWFVLTDPSSTAITKTAAAGEQILENPRWIRPVTTLGSTPSITVIIQATRVG